ncbi:MAG TPA: hypothetical protein VMI53_06650 [Opitutaceae bacterium]|nr:hypothetical protein [Opitutaceae bacterium]
MTTAIGIYSENFALRNAPLFCGLCPQIGTTTSACGGQMKDQRRLPASSDRRSGGAMINAGFREQKSQEDLTALCHCF